MHIMLINHYAGSNIHGMEFRPYYLAREWVECGHEVTIIAASYSHLRQKNKQIHVLEEEYVEGIRYLWLPTSVYQGNGIGRLKNILQFVYQLYKNLSKLVSLKPDAVIASSTYPLDSYPAYKLAKKTRSRFIFELHDLWPLSPMELGKMSKYHPFILLMQQAENFWCRNVDKVISILPSAEKYLQAHGLGNNKFICVPNGIIVSEVECDTKLNKTYQDICDDLHEKKLFLIGYTGAHGIANALDILIEAAAKCKEEQLLVRFILVGQGQEKENLKILVRNKELDNVLFLDSIPKTQINNFLNNMDCLYIGWRKRTLYKYGISPNKLMDYMVAGKPIIHSVSAGNDLVQEADCGISVPAEDVDSIVNAVKIIMSFSKMKRQELGNNGKNYVRANHDYKVLAEKFIKAITD